MPPLDIPKAAAAAPATSSSRLGETESTFSTALIPGVASAAALGAGTSVAELRYINWRHGAVFFAATAVILIAVAAGLRVMGP